MVLSFKSVRKCTALIRAPELVQGRQPSKNVEFKLSWLLAFPNLAHFLDDKKKTKNESQDSTIVPLYQKENTSQRLNKIQWTDP